MLLSILISFFTPTHMRLPHPRAALRATTARHPRHDAMRPRATRMAGISCALSSHPRHAPCPATCSMNFMQCANMLHLQCLHCCCCKHTPTLCET